MIKTEILNVGEKVFIRTYSDAGFLIRKIGTDEIYSEAIDPENSGRTYEETNIQIDIEEES